MRNDFADVLITSDFTSGAGENFIQIAPDHIAFEIPPDPASIRQAFGYDYYFCVRLTNNSAESRKITLDAMRPGYENRQVDWLPSRVPIFISADLRTWYVLDNVQASQTYEEYRCQIGLEPEQPVYLSISIPYPSQRMAAWLAGVQQKNSEICDLLCYGHSIDGRDLLVLSITSPAAGDKDCILVTSGFHPAEPDWLATTTIIAALLADDEWSQQIRRNFVVDIVVQVNPDGFDLGTNACNANGINLYWDFRPLEPDTSPEARHLWAWISAHPPAIYLDFHAYVHQLFKDFRPYLRPLSDYARALRPMVGEIDRELVALCGGRSVQNLNTSLPSTLAAQMTDAFGTVTYPKFHVHLNHGVPACQHLGLAVFKSVVDAAIQYQPLFSKTVPKDLRSGGMGEILLSWWEQSQTGNRIRRVLRRAQRKFDYSEMSQSSLMLQHPTGLAAHWKQHLWSQRDQAVPVIRINDPEI